MCVCAQVKVIKNVFQMLLFFPADVQTDGFSFFNLFATYKILYVSIHCYYLFLYCTRFIYYIFANKLAYTITYIYPIGKTTKTTYDHYSSFFFLSLFLRSLFVYMTVLCVCAHLMIYRFRWILKYFSKQKLF